MTSIHTKIRFFHENERKMVYKYSKFDDTDISEWENIEPILETSFEPDTFQKKAMFLIKEHTHMVICAHTSAGKSLIGQYAVAQALQDNGRCFWLNPIKALTNQVYRKLREKFSGRVEITMMDMYDSENSWDYEDKEEIDNIGIMTGDIKRNEKAPCLVMTNEILLTMCMNNDYLGDVDFVVFDEAHFMNDFERGGVIEQLVRMLPLNITCVFLSATIGNSRNLAEWIGSVRNTQVHIICTNKRPVPLKFHLFTGTKIRGTNKDVWDINDTFIPFWMTSGMKYDHKTVAKCMNSLERQKNIKTISYSQRKGRLLNLVQNLEKHDMLPAILFILSRKRIMTYAKQLNSVDLLCKKRKGIAVRFFNEAIKRIPDQDKEGLQQLMLCRELASRGIGLHHSGLISPVKEAFEHLMQQKGQLKLLLATETVACGIDTPTRTVVFLDLYKFDGTQRRPLSTSEAMQMAGRAGRRGNDKEGNVIVCAYNRNIPDLRKMFLSMSEPIQSRLQLKDQTILSLLSRDSTINVEQLISCTFNEDINRMTQALTLLEEIRKYQRTFKLTDDHEFIKAYLILLNDLKSFTRHTFHIPFLKKALKKGCFVFTINGVNLIKHIVEKTTQNGIISQEEGKTTIPYNMIVGWQNSQSKKLKLKLKRVGLEQSMALSKQIEKFNYILCQDLSNVPDKIFRELDENIYLEQEIEWLKHECSLDALALMPDFRRRCKALKELGFLNENNTASSLGNAAANVKACDSIVLLTWMTSGHAPTKPEEFVALLSCLVYNRMTTREDKNRVEGYEHLEKINARIRQTDNKLGTGILNATYIWARGEPFAKALELTDELAGTFIKSLLRIGDILQQLVKVFQRMQNLEFEVICSKAQTMVCRGIVVCESLYVTPVYKK